MSITITTLDQGFIIQENAGAQRVYSTLFFQSGITKQSQTGIYLTTVNNRQISNRYAHSQWIINGNSYESLQEVANALTVIGIGKYKPNSTGGIFCIVAEEANPLNNNAFEWSYGNGDNSQSDFGIVLPFQCELIALTLNTRQGAATVEAYKNREATGKTVTSNGTTRKAYTDFTNASVKFLSGDSINFKTVTASGNRDGGKVTAWFKTL